MFFIYKMCEGNAYMRAFALILGAATAAVFWSPRPQMFSFFLSAVVLYLLYLYRRNRVDRLWLIPIIMGVWGNLHAGFSIGFIFLGGVIAGEILGRIFNPQGDYLAWRAIRKLILITLISVAALVINPYGLQMLLVPFQTVSIGALRAYIQEWNSPNFQGRETWPFIVLLLGILGAAGASKRRLNWTDFVLVSGTAFMALLAGRNIAVFAVAATPVLTYHLASILTERGWALQSDHAGSRRVMARLNLMLVAVILIGALAESAAGARTEIGGGGYARVSAYRCGEYLADAPPPGELFNSYNWGGYLMFALPDMPVFVDGRTDLVWRQISDAISANGDWWRWLARHSRPVRYSDSVIEKDSGLARRLRDRAGLERRLQDVWRRYLRTG